MRGLALEGGEGQQGQLSAGIRFGMGVGMDMKTFRAGRVSKGGRVRQGSGNDGRDADI